MKKSNLILGAVAMAMIGVAAAVLMQTKAKQRLGTPGVRTEPIPNARPAHVVHVSLPEWVLNYDSREIPQDGTVTNVLPADTSYGQRFYTNRGDTNDWYQLNVVLMGADRTSIHKPQYCLEGAGWRIDQAATQETKIPVERPQAYQLPVVKMLSTRQFRDASGAAVNYRGLYVYWYVADGALSGDMAGTERMWWMAKHLLQTGELQRWAYVSCFAVCLPGEEEAAYDRMKKFIASAVPQFQLVPGPTDTAAATTP